MPNRHPARLAGALSIAFAVGCSPSAAEPAACFPVPTSAARIAPSELSTPEALSLSRGLAPLSLLDVPGLREQGFVLQGFERQGFERQGYQRQGYQRQGLELSLEDLNGVRIEIADTEALVALSDGTMSADGFATTEALENVGLTAINAFGERFAVEVEAVRVVDGRERIALALEGSLLCEDGDEGMFVPGRWDDSGAFVEEPGVLTYSCMSGVIAKCVTWGYAPWEVGSELHQTCTRLARADYCGDGVSWTLQGTTIDVYDVLGVEEPVAAPELSFEAAWGPDGAICVSAPRYLPLLTDGTVAEPGCFAALPRCESLDEARALGAMIADDSAHTPLPACD